MVLVVLGRGHQNHFQDQQKHHQGHQYHHQCGVQGPSGHKEGSRGGPEAFKEHPRRLPLYLSLSLFENVFRIIEKKSRLSEPAEGPSGGFGGPSWWWSYAWSTLVVYVVLVVVFL